VNFQQHLQIAARKIAIRLSYHVRLVAPHASHAVFFGGGKERRLLP
jgi:hypothetical protein